MRPNTRKSPAAQTGDDSVAAGCPRPILAIVNGRLPRARTQRLSADLKRLGADVAVTTYAGHAIELARQANSYRTLIAVGGDGTVSDIATGMNLASHYLAILPAGERNCIARAIGLRSASAAMAALKHGTHCAVDVMETGFVDSRLKRQARRLLGYVACGIEADVTRRRQAGSKLPRFLRDACVTLSATAALKPFKVRIAENEEREREATLSSLLASNCGCTVFTCAMPWNLCDGAVEVLSVRRSVLGQMIRHIRKIGIFPPSRHWRTGVKKLACKFDAPVTMTGDGEVFTGVTALAMAVTPQKLRIIAPRPGPLTHPKWH